MCGSKLSAKQISSNNVRFINPFRVILDYIAQIGVKVIFTNNNNREYRSYPVFTA